MSDTTWSSLFWETERGFDDGRKFFGRYGTDGRSGGMFEGSRGRDIGRDVGLSGQEGAADNG